MPSRYAPRVPDRREPGRPKRQPPAPPRRQPRPFTRPDAPKRAPSRPPGFNPARVVRPSSVARLARETAKLGLKMNPYLRAGMTILDLYEFLRWLQNAKREQAHNYPSLLGLPVLQHCGGVPVTGFFRHSPSSTCAGANTATAWMTQSPNGDYLMDLRPTTPKGYYRLRIMVGPLPKSWTLTQARDGLNPREALRVAELPPTIRRIVEREMPRVRLPTIAEPDRVPEPPPVSEPSPPTNVRVNIGVTPGGTIEVGKSPAPFPASKPPPLS